MIMFFFFSSRRRHTRLQGDWSSDVCSSDLERTERTRLQGGFQVGDFHPGKSKPGGSEGKPRPVRRIDKIGCLKNDASGTRRTPPRIASEPTTSNGGFFPLASMRSKANPSPLS